jgi:4-alpha-glucanotransferase
MEDLERVSAGGSGMDDRHLRDTAIRRGVDVAYHQVSGELVEVGAETLRAVLDALGPEPGPEPAVYVLRRGQPPWHHGLTGVVELEDGTEAALPAELPGELPDGYHAIAGSGRRTPLVIAPDRAYLPPALAGGARDWGLAVQLYSIHSKASWGIGDLHDLGALVPATGDPGFVLTSPLHAPAPGLPVEPSPYFASSRFFRNPLHIAVEHVPEWRAVRRGRSRGLTATPLIDRDAVAAAKDRALRACFTALSPARQAQLDAYRQATPGLELWAADCARLTGGGAGDASYHAYLQLLVDEQLAALPAMRVGLIADLAVGAAPGGFDDRIFRSSYLRGLRVGAPPDPLGPLGQDWGIPAFHPGALARDGYGLFARLLRANMAHAGGLRIDHVMGLFRLYVIPNGMPASAGTYVRYPASDLLAVLALESRRARCLVIGEDLGTVEPGVREALAAHDILSYRVARFEEGPAAEYPRLALAAATTHDLPTTAAFLAGRVPDVAAAARELHETIAATPSMLACAALEDVASQVVQPNVPGTIDEHPNWRVRLPLAIEDLPADAGAQGILAAIRR